MGDCKNVLEYYSLDYTILSADIDFENQIISATTSFHITYRDRNTLYEGKYFFTCHAKQVQITSISISSQKPTYNYKQPQAQATEIASYALPYKDLQSYEYCQRVSY